MDEDVCAICMDALSADHAHTLARCGHAFHSSCIIEWMQRGNVNCPTCRADAHLPGMIGAMALRDRAKYIRRTWGRRANAPPELKRLLTTLRAAERAETDRRREYYEHKRSHRDVIGRMNALHRSTWNARCRTKRLERVLGLFQAPGLGLPALSPSPYS